MAESIVQVTEGTGKKLHTWSRTIGANTVEDEYVIPGEYPNPAYNIVGGSVAFSTANSHILQVMASASLKVRVRRVRIYQTVAATALAFFSMELWRLTTAGTGGTSITPRPFDTADAAAGCTAMTLPTVKGTESVQLDNMTFTVVGAATAGAGLVWEWEQHPGTPPLIIPTGAANGLAWKNISSAAAGSMRVIVEAVESAF